VPGPQLTREKSSNHSQFTKCAAKSSKPTKSERYNEGIKTEEKKIYFFLKRSSLIKEMRRKKRRVKTKPGDKPVDA